MAEEKNNEIKVENGIEDNPETFKQIEKRFGIKYMTSVPNYTPKQRTDIVVHFNGTATYTLYIYANGGWRSVVLT